MEGLKQYLAKNAEQVFALTILVGVAGINHFVPYKLVFFNFGFMVVLLGLYYLEMRQAVLGAVLCALVVTIHVYYFPIYFMPVLTELDLWMSVLAWCCFLILTGALMGRHIGRLKAQLEQLQQVD